MQNNTKNSPKINILRELDVIQNNIKFALRAILRYNSYIIVMLYKVYNCCQHLFVDIYEEQLGMQLTGSCEIEELKLKQLRKKR